jgi:2-aminomuconate deaminase
VCREAINRGEKADITQARNQYISYVNSVKDKLASKDELDNKQSANGEAFILQENAKSLANYPHMRAYGGLLYVSGISSRRPDNTHEGAEKLADGSFKLDVALQTRAVLNNIKKILSSAGADLSHVINATVYLTDMQHYADYNKAYNEFFPVPELAPTRTTVAVKQLPHPNLLIEIQTVAVDPRSTKH